MVSPIATLLVGLFSSVALAEFQKCTPGYCLQNKCNNVKCHGKNKILYHNVTTCGCCDLCITQLEKNSDCLLTMKNNVPNIQCGPHLLCQKDQSSPTKARCKKMADISGRGGCEFEQQKMDKNQFKMFGFEPECDQFGDYSLRQCKNGTLCQCVKTFRDSKTNEIKTRPIFGTDIYTNAQHMKCLCSYQFENMNEKLREFTHSLAENQRWQRLPADGGTNQKWNNGKMDIEKIFYIRCQANGNFESFQSYANYSYCVHEQTGQVLNRPVLSQYAKELPCYSKRYSFKTKCLTEYNQTVKRYYQLKKNYGQIVTFDLPNCDLDGTYAPVQCKNDKCYCVNKNGEKYLETSVDRRDKYFSPSHCSCVRNRDLIRDMKKRNEKTELFGKYQCDKNGNYLPIQCFNHQCYCIDPVTSFVNTDSFGSINIVPMEDIKSLPCFQAYPDQDRLGIIFEEHF